MKLIHATGLTLLNGSGDGFAVIDLTLSRSGRSRRVRVGYADGVGFVVTESV